MPVKYSIRKSEKCGCTIVEGEIIGGVLDIKELEEAVKSAPEVDTTQGVCISGRMPVWLYVALAHKYHPSAWVGTFEPRLGKCVVTSTHRVGIRIGELREI